MRRGAAQPHLAGIDPGPSARVRQEAGEEVERWVEHVHRLCEIRGVAWARQVSVHLRIVAGGKVVPAKAGTIDCLGVLRGGRALGVEVKSCSENRLDFTRLPPQQRAHLDIIDRLGGVALVLVVGPTHAWAVPWRKIAERIASRAKSAVFSSEPSSEVPVILRRQPHAYLAAWAEGA